MAAKASSSGWKNKVKEVVVLVLIVFLAIVIYDTAKGFLFTGLNTATIGTTPAPDTSDPAYHFKMMAPAGYQLNSLDIPNAGRKSCEERGGQIVPDLQHSHVNPETGNIEGKNICTADAPR